MEIERRILSIRGKKVMLDADLAAIYGVKTKQLNQQVNRNLRRFPADFAFVLTEKEKAEVVTNCDHLRGLRFSHTLPYAFTELGVAMLSSVLHSERAIQANIAIMRAFVQLRLGHGESRDTADQTKAVIAIFNEIRLLPPKGVRPRPHRRRRRRIKVVATVEP